MERYESFDFPVEGDSLLPLARAWLYLPMRGHYSVFGVGVQYVQCYRDVAFVPYVLPVSNHVAMMQGVHLKSASSVCQTPSAGLDVVRSY